MKRHIITNALISAGVTTAYIMGIASFLKSAEAIFDNVSPKDTVLIPIVMLLLLVVSATITGTAVFGKPVMWYLDGKKKEALTLLITTIVLLSSAAFIFISILITK